MKIRIRASKLVLTDAIREYIETKMAMLEKYINKKQLINFDFEVERVAGKQHSGDIFRAEANVQVPHDLLRVEKTEFDLYKAIDKVKDHLEEILIKYQDKKIDKIRAK